MRAFYALLLAMPCLAHSMRVTPHAKMNTKGKVQTTVSTPLATFPQDMWFGLATAAAHVERAYPNDPWIAWAKRGHVAAYNSSVAGPDPDMRLRFLEEPEVELDLAAATGVQVFRMGVEWGRLVPNHPEDGEGVQDQAALQRYREIILMAKKRNMKVMLTLFHHSMPLWSSAFGGWTEDASVQHFMAFAKDVTTELADVVDYWVTFNEPHIYVLLSNCAGLWPPGPVQPVVDQLACLSGALPWISSDSGGYTKAMGNIERAHIEFYNWAHAEDSPVKSPKIGVAHNVAWNEAYGVSDMASVAITERLFKFSFIDALKGHMDWLGLNYYSKELLAGAGPMLLPTEEYSESGRQLYPDGLFDVLMQFNDRFPQSDPDVKFKSIIITENGISDASDILRPGYLVEHLLAVREAQHRGVPIEGYVHWTISDNWEWADGYCPKFGLVDVDRSDDRLARTVRQSYNLFKDIVGKRSVTEEQRDNAWENVRQAILSNASRPFCRASDGKTGLDDPVPRQVINTDWRFTKLSSAEGQCHSTPWVAWNEKDDILAHASSGECDALPASSNLPAHCRRSVWLKREKRCPDADPEIEYRGSVCEGSKMPGLSTNASECGSWFHSLRAKCCCDADGRCGLQLPSLLKRLSSCPDGLKASKNTKCAE